MSSSIVNDLIRAANSIPSNITDDELDKYVAELLVKEAKEKEVKWKEMGIGVYLDSMRDEPSSSALPKPNKRFLSSVIRQVDDHNTALLREQALAARQANEALRSNSGSPARSRDYDSSRAGSSRVVGDGRNGNGTAAPRRAGGGAARLFGGALGAASGSKSRQSEVEAERRREERKSDGKAREDRDGPRREVREREEGRERRRDQSCSRDAEREGRGNGHDRLERGQGNREHRDDRYQNKRHADNDDRNGKSRDSRRERARSRSRERDVGRAERKSRKHRGDSVEHATTSRRSHSPITRNAPKPFTSDIHLPAHFVANPTTSFTSPPEANPDPTLPPITSKMDHYFSETYDPRLDFSGVLPIPKEGLVQEVGWDNMLAVLKEKGKKRRDRSPRLSESPPPTGGGGGRYRSPDRYASSSKRYDFISSPPTAKSKHKSKSKSNSKSKSYLSDSADEHPSSSSKKRKSKQSSRHHDDDDEGGHSSESSDTRDRRKRKKRKEKEKRKEVEEEEERKKGGGYLYAKKGAVREWDVGKVDLSF